MYKETCCPLKQRFPGVFSISGEAGYMIGSGMTYPEDCVLHMEARPFLPQDFLLDPKGKSQVKN
jgi:hypothetical protein